MNYLLLLISVALSLNSICQNALNLKNKHTLSLGYGDINLLSSKYKKLTQNENNTSFSNRGVINIKYSFGINKNTEIGLNFSQQSLESTFGTPYNMVDSLANGRWDFRDSWSLLFRFNHHQAINAKTSLYYGGGVGFKDVLQSSFYYINGESTISEHYYKNELKQKTINFIDFEATVGIRHKLTPYIGLYAEAGYAKSFVQGGIVINTNPLSIDEKIKRLENKRKKKTKLQELKKLKKPQSSSANYFSIGGGIALYDVYQGLESSTPSINFKYERNKQKTISWGINIAYFQRNLGSYYDYHYNSTGQVVYEERDASYSTGSLLFRLNANIINTRKANLYIGGGVGVRYGSYIHSADFKKFVMLEYIPLGMEFTSGIKYFVNDNIGVYAEIGLAKSIAQFGIVTKF